MKAVENGLCCAPWLKAGVNDNEKGIGTPSSPRTLRRVPPRRADLQQVEREPISTLAKG
jgi:hypothetical protein